MEKKKYLISVLLIVIFVCIKCTFVYAEDTGNSVVNTNNDELIDSSNTNTNSNSNTNTTVDGDSSTTANNAELQSSPALSSGAQSSQSEININYYYNSSTNTVTVAVSSEIGFKNNKPSWNLSSDKKTYSKTFDKNQTYSTSFTQSNGNTVSKSIVINQVKDMVLSTSYTYDATNNIVTVTVTSNVPMKDNKPSWALSSDRKRFTKSFGANMSYSTPFTQSNGKVVNAVINVTQIKTMVLSVSYQYNSVNNTITAIVSSNYPMKNTKPTWTLSSDKKTYFKVFDKNMNYSTPFTQGNGTVVNFPINITQVKTMELSVSYSYDSVNNAIIATVTSNYPMKNTKPTWTLSSDKKTYTKSFGVNQYYETPFTQNNGTVVNFGINITGVKPIILTADYSYNSSKTYVTVTVTSNYPMVHTKPTWTLSADKKSYSKVFDANMNYTTPFTQSSGAVTNFRININQIRDFILTPNYYYSSDRRSVTVVVSSNFRMQNNKPTWNYSADGFSFNKVFVDNQAYVTTFTDEYGRKRDVFINVTDIYKGPELISDVTLTSPKSGADRNVNLSIASNTISGIVLNPGDVFVWSRVVGQATSAKGYRMAAVFQGNSVVNGLGGGICQVSSTLYQAVRNIGLNIIERHSHSQPVTYTTLGNDATVSYGSLDFIFQNNKPYAIQIIMQANGGSVNCKIYRI